MADIDFRSSWIRKIPEICNRCQWLDSEDDEYGYPICIYCSLNVFLPTKKQDCKRFV